METGGLREFSGMEEAELRSHGITESRREGIRMSGMWNYGSGFLVEFRIGEDLRTVLQ